MKFKFFVLGFLAALLLGGSAFSQADHTITLNDTLPNYISPTVLKVIVGETVQFVRTSSSGEFAIFLEDAIYYLGVDDINLEIKLDDSNTSSDVIPVESTYDQESANLWIYVYCISENNWADAPPLIIIRNE